jgi:G protein beta subunit-like protein
MSTVRSVLLATGGYDHCVRLWEASNGTCYQKLQHEGSQINELEISPNKQWIAAAGNPQIRLYDVNASDTKPTRTFEGHSNNVTAIGFHKEGKWLYSGSEDGSLKIWDLRASGVAREFSAPNCQREYENRSAINTVALHPNQGELLTGDQSGHIRVFDLAENKMSHSMMMSEENVAVRSISVATDGSIATAASDTECAVWRLRKGDNMACEFFSHRQFTAHSKYILKCLISPNICSIATTSADATVRIWSVPAILEGSSDTTRSTVVRDPSTTVKNSSGEPSAESGLQPVDEATTPSDEASAADTPVAKLSAAGASLQHRGLLTGLRPTKELVGHQRWVWDAVFSADSAYIVTASSDGVRSLPPPVVQWRPYSIALPTQTPCDYYNQGCSAAEARTARRRHAYGISNEPSRFATTAPGRKQ